MSSPLLIDRAAARHVALLAAALLCWSATTAEAAHRRHRRHHVIEPAPVAEPMAEPPRPQDRAAYQSGFAFGLLDLGISGTPTALSPYVQGGYGYVRPGYDGPGFGYPGY